MTDLCFYALGVAITLDLVLAWFRSNLAQHVWNLMHGEKIFTKEDLTEAAARSGALGDLWVCPMCLGTWFSFFISTALWLLGAPPWIIPAGTFTWPGLVYLVMTKA